MSSNFIVVEPRSKKNIDFLMMDYLDGTISSHLNNPGILNVEELIDLHLYQTHGFSPEITNNIRNNAEAETLPLEKKIQFRPHVHDGICDKIPHHLSTGCHEAAHVILHAEQIIGWDIQDYMNAVNLSRKNLPVYYSSEWQAYYAAGALLMPKITFIPFVEDLIKLKASFQQIVDEIICTYGVSYSSAKKRLEKLDLFDEFLF